MTRDEIMKALASAGSLDEQIKLVAELDALDHGRRTTAAQERELDWADTTIKQTFASTGTLDRHTASSDWLADADTSGGNHHQAIIAEASMWFQRLDADVKADAGEFTEQARGVARRTAGKYGEAADDAAQAFLQYVAFLNRQVLAASGLPQVQQEVDAFENPAATPLPTDVFPTFGDPVHPINTGVDGQQTNSLAPGAEMAMSEGGTAAGRPSEHEEGQDPVSQPYNPPASAKQGSHKVAGMLERAKHEAAQRGHAMNWQQVQGGNDAWQGQCTGCGSSMAVTASGIVDGSTAHRVGCTNRTVAGLSQPSVAHGYGYTMNDFLAAEAARKAGGAAPFVREAGHGGGWDPDHDGDDDSTPGGDTDHDYWDADGKQLRPVPNNDARHEGARKEGRSGLDQVQQIVDSKEDPRPTSLPTDVMFPVDQPWPETETSEVLDQGGQDTGPTNRPRQATRKTADTWQGGDAPAAVPGGETPVANSPATTDPRANSGDFQKGVSQGQADAAAGERPSFADNSSAVSDFVRGYVQGYGPGQPDMLPQDVPASMGGDSGQGRNFGEIQQRTEKPLVMASKTAKDYSEAERENLADKGEARPDGSFPIKTKKDLENAKHDVGRANDPEGAREWINERAKEMGEPGLGEKKSGLTVSASMLTKDISGDSAFLRGYRYARRWKDGDQIVGLGSTGEEAGIYSGITDNPQAQQAWVTQHRAMMQDYPELRTRMRQHRLVTANYQSRNEDAIVKGLYVQAATSLDLDTMSPTTSPDPQGATPSEGPGTVPILRDAPGTPAAPGGPAPYNGAEPLGAPVVPDPLMNAADIQQPQSPDAVNITGDSSLMSHNPTAMAFRKRVQAGKLALRQNKEN